MTPPPLFAREPPTLAAGQQASARTVLSEMEDRWHRRRDDSGGGQQPGGICSPSWRVNVNGTYGSSLRSRYWRHGSSSTTTTRSRPTHLPLLWVSLAGIGVSVFAVAAWSFSEWVPSTPGRIAMAVCMIFFSAAVMTAFAGWFLRNE